MKYDITFNQWNSLRMRYYRDLSQHHYSSRIIWIKHFVKHEFNLDYSEQEDTIPIDVNSFATVEGPEENITWFLLSL